MGRIHLGTILGTTITLDFSFIILIAFFVLTDLNSGMHALLWAPVLFISILFHELAHAAMIGAFGFGGSAIVLEGIGGVTINERRARPWQDMLISAAGPAASFLLAYVIGIVRARLPYAHTDPFLIALLPLLRWANIVWGVFNLMPVFPLDGSSVLRNFLRIVTNERLAFVIAVWVSMIAGTVLAVLGLINRQIFLCILMAWYVRNSYIQWQFFKSYNRPED
jgi:stage IV sporulation protein FB